MDDQNWGYVESKGPYHEYFQPTDWSRPTPLISCPACKNECSRNAASCPRCGHVFKPTSTKSKGAAIVLALILGGVGVHKFYLDRPWQGIFYLLFAWTFLPAIFALIDAVSMALMSQEDFTRKYR